ERAQRLAQQVTPSVGYLPDPADVLAHLPPSAGEGDGKVVLPYLPAPSNYLAFDWLGRLDVTVARAQKPDPRLPRGRVDHLLWTYEDARPAAALAPPAPGVASAVADLAG